MKTHKSSIPPRLAWLISQIPSINMAYYESILEHPYAPPLLNVPYKGNTIIYFVCHGKTLYGHDRLDAVGELQSKCVAEYFADIAFDAAFSSDVKPDLDVSAEFNSFLCMPMLTGLTSLLV